MKKPKKLLITGALSLLLLAETVMAAPAVAMAAPEQKSSTRISSKTYNSPRATEEPDLAFPSDNGLYWISRGATYRAGANLQFYATGAGYGPEEPQELNPIKNSTRYKPVSWSVGNQRGSWKRYTDITGGYTSHGFYVQAEYRFKGSFTLNTNSSSKVPFTLKVNYQKEIYNGKKWVKARSRMVSKSVRFYIRNVSGTDTKPPRPTVGTYKIRGNVVYRVSGPSALTAMTPVDRSIRNLRIPNSITINGYYYQVKAISKEAFANCPNLRTAVIGENVTSIGKNAFKGSKKLGTVAIQTSRLTKSKVGANAFKGIKSDCLFKTPSLKTSAYKKLLKSKGAGKEIRVKKFY